MDCQKSKLVQPAAENSDYGDSIPSNRLKEALRATPTFGRAAQDTMFHDLELNRITFKDRSCTLSELLDAQEDISA